MSVVMPLRFVTSHTTEPEDDRDAEQEHPVREPSPVLEREQPGEVGGG